MAHEFDLLGSGPVIVRHGLACRGLEGHRYPAGPTVRADPTGEWLVGRVNGPNVAESRRIWTLVDTDYTPIDWHLDFKSGWRWNEATWYRDVAYGTTPGADVKVPWELARLQHLPQLALAAVVAKSGTPGLESTDRLAREVRNQALDFVATNPPRFGVNWTVTMDVAIRAANLLLARDLLAGAGLSWDDPADAVIRRSIFEHGRHIAENLEWDPEVRGNHYLADLVGLVFAATHLDGEPEASEWLAMATTELAAELDLQFNRDGTSFEGSTSYHRLSAEMAVYCTALLVGRPDGLAGLPPDMGRRLAAMAAFTDAVTGPDGTVAQIGDNDSGRFVKLTPSRPDRALDHRHLMDAVLGLVPGVALRASPSPGIDRAVIAALAGGAALPLPSAAPIRREGPSGESHAVQTVVDRIGRLPERARARYVIPAPGQDLRSGLRLSAFPDGGYYVAASDRIHLVVRCGAIGHHGHGGHDHDDQLSFDLWLDGLHVIADPGTYLYTPVPAMRNRYRSAADHSGPRTSGPDAVDLEAYPFQLHGATPGVCLAWGDAGFAGSRTDRHGRVALATIRWLNDRIEVDHGVEGGDLHPSRRSDDWQVLRPEAAFSPGYGLLVT
jgi:hypothetical protein